MAIIAKSALKDLIVCVVNVYQTFTTTAVFFIANLVCPVVVTKSMCWLVTVLQPVPLCAHHVLPMSIKTAMGYVSLAL
jgi:hypothetical protein